MLAAFALNYFYFASLFTQGIIAMNLFIFPMLYGLLGYLLRTKRPISLIIVNIASAAIPILTYYKYQDDPMGSASMVIMLAIRCPVATVSYFFWVWFIPKM